MDDFDYEAEPQVELPDHNGRWGLTYKGYTPSRSIGGRHDWEIGPTSAPETFNESNLGHNFTIHYDPNRAHVEWDEHEGQRLRPYAVVHGSDKLTDLAGGDKHPGHLFRGMSDEEFQEAKQRGHFQSKGDWNLGGTQEGRTYFTPSLGTAEHYSNGYAPMGFRPTFDKPAHVIGIPDQPENPDYQREQGGHEVGVKGQIPFDSLTHHWTGHAAAIRPGTLDVRDNGWGEPDKPFMGMQPSVDVQWEPGEAMPTPDESTLSPRARQAHRYAALPTDGDLVLYHGTHQGAVDGIRRDGLRPPPASMLPAQWFMLTTDKNQAHDYSRDGTVLEYHVPRSQVFRDPEHQRGEPFSLWPPDAHTAYGYDAQAYAINDKLPSEFLHAVHTPGKTTVARVIEAVEQDEFHYDGPVDEDWGDPLDQNDYDAAWDDHLDGYEYGHHHRYAALPTDGRPCRSADPESARNLIERYASDEDYRMQHQAPDAQSGAPLHDVNNMMPDFYSHPHYYHNNDPDYMRSSDVVRRAHQQPEKKVVVYRALPAEHAHKGINPGDWVSTSKEYARLHGMHSTDSKHDWPVISAKVPAKHLHTEGDLNEWGYNGPTPLSGTVAYKGGYHQEVRQRADGSIGRVKRRPLTPDQVRAQSLKDQGYSFSYYPPGRFGPQLHDVSAWNGDDWVGNLRADGDGNITESNVGPTHAHLPIEEHMRSLLPFGDAQKSRQARNLIELYAGVEEYQGGHQAPTNDGYNVPAHDLEGFYPNVYENPHWYEGDRESVAAMRAARGNPDAMVNIYRALPHPHSTINQGDWVTPSLAYAKQHAQGNFADGETVHVVKAKVPAKHLWSEGNSLNELGYDPGHSNPLQATPATRPRAYSDGASGYRPYEAVKRQAQEQDFPADSTQLPSVGAHLESRIAKPSEDSCINHEVDSAWLSNGFDSIKDGIRDGGARAITHGYSGPPQGPEGSGWRLQRLLRDNKNPAGHDIIGGELVSRAVHGEPTTKPLWRGASHDSEYLASLQPGHSLTLPLSSFTPRYDAAKRYAQPAEENWASGDRPANGKPVIYRLEPGAKAARLSPHPERNPDDEHVAFGDFRVTSVTPDKSWRGDGPTEIGLRHKSLEPTGNWSYTGLHHAVHSEEPFSEGHSGATFGAVPVPSQSDPDFEHTQSKFGSVIEAVNDDIEDILNLIGPGVKPAESAPDQPETDWNAKEQNAYRQTPDDSSTAHLWLPTHVLDHYREHDREPSEALQDSIFREGVKQPVRISTDGTHALLHEGNHRLAAAKSQGIRHLPVQVTLDPEVHSNGGRPPQKMEPMLGNWVTDNAHRLNSMWD